MLLKHMAKHVIRISKDYKGELFEHLSAGIWLPLYFAY